MTSVRHPVPPAPAAARPPGRRTRRSGICRSRNLRLEPPTSYATCAIGCRRPSSRPPCARRGSGGRIAMAASPAAARPRRSDASRRSRRRPRSLPTTLFTSPTMPSAYGLPNTSSGFQEHVLHVDHHQRRVLRVERAEVVELTTARDRPFGQLGLVCHRLVSHIAPAASITAFARRSATKLTTRPTRRPTWLAIAYSSASRHHRSPGDETGRPLLVPFNTAALRPDGRMASLPHVAEPGDMADPFRTAIVMADIQVDVAAAHGVDGCSGTDISAAAAVDRIEAVIRAARQEGAMIAFMRNRQP